MKAVVYSASERRAKVVEMPKPSISHGEVLVAVEAAGLCGSDLLKLEGPKAGGVLGHEVAGTVAEASEVTGFKPGDRVVLAHHAPCGSCHYCRRGSPSMCRKFKAMNLDPGGFSEFVRAVPELVAATLIKVPAAVPAEAACLTEPLACCLRNMKRLRVGTGDAVGVVGLGSIGLLTGQLARHLGARVVGFDLDAERLELASGLGIEAPDGREAAGAVQRLSEGRGLDSLIFTAGPASLLSERLAWVRDGGALGVFAELPGAQALDVKELYHREISLVTSYSSSPEDLRQALHLIAEGAVDVSALTRHRFPLEAFDEAVAQTRSRKILKAILRPA